MGLFDFLKGSAGEAPSIDLNDLRFTSNDHIRYQNGKDVSGHNYDCWRGIRVQKNVSGGQGYTVTMYNLDGNHSTWGNNVQMAPKQMKIIEQNSTHIKLRGFGNDQMGNSFADYGLTLHLNNRAVDKVSLHMHDRSVDILYLKADDNSKKSKSSEPQQLTPATNMQEIMLISQVIHNCRDLDSLGRAYAQYGNYNHPHICYDFGVSFLIRDDMQRAKKALSDGALYGIRFPCSLYDTPFADSVGQCLSLLMTQFPIGNNEIAAKVTALAYVFLSKAIERYPREAHDSYRTRALLFKDHENPMVVQSLIMNNAGMGVLVEPYIISDFFFASQATDSPHTSAYQSAARIHQSLDDMSIGGKDADEYSLQGMAEFGEKRHLILFKTLEGKYKNHEFDLTVDELSAANR